MNLPVVGLLVLYLATFPFLLKVAKILGLVAAVLFLLQLILKKKG